MPVWDPISSGPNESTTNLRNNRSSCIWPGWLNKSTNCSVYYCVVLKKVSVKFWVELPEDLHLLHFQHSKHLSNMHTINTSLILFYMMDELLCHCIQSANGWAHRAMWNKSKDSTCRLPRGLASLFHKTPQECAHNQYNLCFSFRWMDELLCRYLQSANGRVHRALWALPWTSFSIPL